MTGQGSAWTSTEGERRSSRSVGVWSLIWVGTFLAADKAIGRGWIDGDVAIVIVTAVVALLGAGWILSYVRFIRNADELMRKIQLDAMAVALGTGFVAGFALLLLDTGDVVETRLSYLLVAMVITYIGVAVAGLRRYGSTEP